MKHIATLEIVWRNPNPAQHMKRWELLERNSGGAHYLIQESFSTDGGAISIWVPTSTLDVVPGGQAA